MAGPGIREAHPFQKFACRQTTQSAINDCQKPFVTFTDTIDMFFKSVVAETEKLPLGFLFPAKSQSPPSTKTEWNVPPAWVDVAT